MKKFLTTLKNNYVLVIVLLIWMSFTIIPPTVIHFIINDTILLCGFTIVIFILVSDRKQIIEQLSRQQVHEVLGVQLQSEQHDFSLITNNINLINRIVSINRPIEFYSKIKGNPKISSIEVDKLTRDKEGMFTGRVISLQVEHNNGYPYTTCLIKFKTGHIFTIPVDDIVHVHYTPSNTNSGSRSATDNDSRV